MSHPHVSAYTNAMSALASGDVDGYMPLLAEDVQWWDLGSSEPLIGSPAVAERLQRSSGLGLETDLHDVLANDEHLVALVHARARIGLEKFDVSYAEVLHFNDAGTVRKRQVFPSDIWAALKLLESSAESS